MKEYVKSEKLRRQREERERLGNLDVSKKDFVAASLCDDPKEGNKSVLSYSLYGRKMTETARFIKEVANEAKSLELYKDFTVRIYVDPHFSSKMKSELKSNHSNLRFCDITNVPGYGNLSSIAGKIWRFMPMADMTLNVFCSRHLHSPLLQREVDAVRTWLKTSTALHVMRDRKMHHAEILGGMWCFRNSKNPHLGQLLLDKVLTESLKSTKVSLDQDVLKRVVWRVLKHDSLQHDAYSCKYFPGSKPFPTKRRNYFVGCIRDCWVFPKIKCPAECRPSEHPDWEHC